MRNTDGTSPNGQGQGRGQGRCHAGNGARRGSAGGRGGRGQEPGRRDQGSGASADATNHGASWMQRQISDLRALVQRLTERLDSPKADLPN
jgi:hypothetical protein